MIEKLMRTGLRWPNGDCGSTKATFRTQVGGVNGQWSCAANVSGYTIKTEQFGIVPQSGADGIGENSNR
jgi:hypothetical protein